MPIIKPSIGRVVWYRPSPNESIVGNDGAQPLAAIVAYVHSDTCVNLAVFDANGNSHSRTSVRLHQGDQPSPTDSHAEWMPYQLGQAAKTEAIEASQNKPSAE